MSAAVAAAARQQAAAAARLRPQLMPPTMMMGMRVPVPVSLPHHVMGMGVLPVMPQFNLMRPLQPGQYTQYY